MWSMNHMKSILESLFAHITKGERLNLIQWHAGELVSLFMLFLEGPNKSQWPLID